MTTYLLRRVAQPRPPADLDPDLRHLLRGSPRSGPPHPRFPSAGKAGGAAPDEPRPGATDLAAVPRRPGSIRAPGATVFIFALVSTPTFVLGGVLLFITDDLLSSHGIHAFPFPGTWTPLHVNPLAWADNLALPWITLALVSAAVYARLSRSSLTDALREDYVRTARAKGLSERRVLYRHALRAALTPLISQFGIDLAAVLSGVVVVETVFGIPGLGHQLITAVDTEDLPMIQGIALLTSAFVVTANLVVDLLYAVIDPRVRTIHSRI